MFRAMFSPIIRSTWLYLQYLVVLCSFNSSKTPAGSRMDEHGFVKVKFKNRLICFFLWGGPTNLQSLDVGPREKRGMCVLRIAVILKLDNARGYPVDLKIEMNMGKVVGSPLAVNNMY
jgi:hypothetical protein